MNLIPTRALLSVSDKEGLIEFAQTLIQNNVQLISTGGTAKALREAGLKVTDVKDVTGAPEILGGRVKTLHPQIHGGILMRPDLESDQKDAEANGIMPIDLVVVNLYPFKQTIDRDNVTEDEAIEQIDIGGVALLRAAAKNFQHVAVVTAIKDYKLIIDELKNQGGILFDTRRKLAIKAFEKIVVTDDGHGMDEMDARLAFERHATSKIGGLDDLNRIKTLGFRGEALASIASVSEVFLQTKTKQSLGGVRLEMTGGKEPIVASTGCSVGTKIDVSNLFFNTPARKKYLKSEATEYRHVLDTVQDLALAHPEVGFRFVSNGRPAFDLLKTDKLQARVGGLFGKSVSEEMVDVFYGGRDLQISGWIGKPHTARATRKYQYFVINGRPIQDNRLGYAVKEAFSNLIPGSQYPIFVLNVTVDPTQVDVNVHPRKLEVRFAQPNEIFRVMKASVAAALARELQSSMTPNVSLQDKNLEMPAFLRKESIRSMEREKIEVEESGGDYDPSVAMAPPLNFFGGASGAATPSVFDETSYSASSNAMDARKAYLLQKRAERMATQGMDSPPSLPASGPVSSIFGSPSASFSMPTPPTVAEVTQSYMEDRPTGSLRALAQVKNSYIVAQDDDGIVIIDQHAAHERVMLGKFRANEAEREPARQSLLAPHQLNLDYREKAILEENLDLLRSLGFDISEFGGSTYSIDSVPDFLVDDDILDVIKGFLDDLLNDQSPREAARRHEHILHTLACRAAAKFGRRLSTYEQESLIKSLLETEGSSACAHGRPTMIRLSFNELEQKFGRRG